MLVTFIFFDLVVQSPYPVQPQALPPLTVAPSQSSEFYSYNILKIVKLSANNALKFTDKKYDAYEYASSLPEGWDERWE